jgi:hypothetical protein
MTPAFRTGLLAGLLAVGAAAITVLVLRRSDVMAFEFDDELPEMDDPLDEAAAESFPASDPPAQTATVGATPVR